MPWLQYFTKSPYENKQDPETGLPERPSIWQTLGHPQDSAMVRRDRAAYGQFAATDKPLASNPNYDPAGIDPFGSDNPYLRPSAATAYQHPETMRQYMQAENQPFELQQDINRMNTLAPVQLQQDITRESAMAPIKEKSFLNQAENLARLQNKLQSEFLPQKIKDSIAEARARLDFTTSQDIPETEIAKLNAEMKTQPTRSKMEIDHLKALANAERERHANDLEIMRGSLPEEDRALPKEVLAVMYPSAKMTDVLNQLSAKERIKAGVPKSSAEAESAEYISAGRKAIESNKLGVPEAQARQSNFESRTGLPLGGAWQSPMMSDISSGQYVARPNTQYSDPQTLENQTRMSSMMNQAREGEAGRVGIIKARPAMGFGMDNLSTNAAIPPSLAAVPQESIAPLVKSPTQVDRPSAWQGPPQPRRTAFGGTPITDMEFWNNIGKKVSKLAPKGSNANP